MVPAAPVVVVVPHRQTLGEASAAAQVHHEWPMSQHIGTAAIADSSTSADAAKPASVVDVAPGTLAANRIAAVALLDGRLVALHVVQIDRDRAAAHYNDACAGKVTSAGWLLRGELITTPNAETPVCRAMATDLEKLTRTFNLDHAAIAETARTRGILPGVLRALFMEHDLPAE